MCVGGDGVPKVYLRTNRKGLMGEKLLHIYAYLVWLLGLVWLGLNILQMRRRSLTGGWIKESAAAWVHKCSPPAVSPVTGCIVMFVWLICDIHSLAAGQWECVKCNSLRQNADRVSEGGKKQSAAAETRMQTSENWNRKTYVCYCRKLKSFNL